MLGQIRQAEECAIAARAENEMQPMVDGGDEEEDEEGEEEDEEYEFYDAEEEREIGGVLSWAVDEVDMECGAVEDDDEEEEDDEEDEEDDNNTVKEKVEEVKAEEENAEEEKVKDGTKAKGGRNSRRKGGKHKLSGIRAFKIVSYHMFGSKSGFTANSSSCLHFGGGV